MNVNVAHRTRLPSSSAFLLLSPLSSSFRPRWFPAAFSFEMIRAVAARTVQDSTAQHSTATAVDYRTSDSHPIHIHILIPSLSHPSSSFVLFTISSHLPFPSHLADPLFETARRTLVWLFPKFNPHPCGVGGVLRPKPTLKKVPSLVLARHGAQHKYIERHLHRRLAEALSPFGLWRSVACASSMHHHHQHTSDRRPRERQRRAYQSMAGLCGVAGNRLVGTVRF
jgi:hypothetical protein